VSLPSAKRESGIDLREPTSIFRYVADEIDRNLGVSAQVDEYLLKYADDPVGFGERVLGEQYTEDVKAMMLSVRDNPITIAKSGNATGKTHGAREVAVWWFLTRPGAQVYTAAAPPESNLKKVLWGEINSTVEKNPKLFEGMSVTSLHITRSALEFLAGVTIPASGTDTQREAKFSGKHAPYLLFVVDEGDAVPEEVYRGIESCMSGGVARLLVMFNPRSEAGILHRLERDGRANVVHLSAFRHPNVVEGRDVIPGAVSRETTVRRINEWARPLAVGEEIDSECFQLPDFLEGATARSQAGHEYAPLVPGWYRIMDPAFSYMCLGQYPSAPATQLISKEWIMRARARWDAYVRERGEKPPDGIRGVAGLDVAELGVDANCLCFRYGGFVGRMLTWGGIDVIATGDRAAREFKGRKLGRVLVDATGVGAGVSPHMRRQGVAAFPCKVASSPTTTTELGEFHLLRDQLWWACREWLRCDPGAMLPPDEMLVEELCCPTYEVRAGKIRVMTKDTMKELLRRSPDRADALCLTFFEPELLFPGL
jgi:hypothetical protein